MIRLDKYLADMGIGTRQEVKKYVRQGRITIDGMIIKKPEYKVDETTQLVMFDQKNVCYEAFEYYMLNKPAGVISATEDTKSQTVIDLIDTKKRKDLFPVGRLDKDTEGLLLITNDGALAHRLLSPKHHVDKCYFAKIRGIVDESDRDSFKKGVNIGTPENEEWTMPGELEILKTDECSGMSDIRLTIQEGKYHQVKRMFLARGKEVVYLKRERMGNLILDEKLFPGEYRKLTDEEIKNL
ncbi:MAG: pseudouridine synthase [Lachnospiraceae bacterium]